MRFPSPSTRLRDRTLTLLRSLPRDHTLKDVADAAGLPVGWLQAFARGEISEPSVNRIECLWEHLTGNRLGID